MITKENAAQWMRLVEAAAEGRLEVKNGAVWENIDGLSFRLDVASYRIRPELREGYVNIYPAPMSAVFHDTRELADRDATHRRCECVHMREVIE